MGHGYLPTREAEQVTWFTDFDRNLSSKPAEYFGLGEQTIEDYHTTFTRFIAAYGVASNPETRTRPNIELKQIAKQTLINSTRSLVEVIQAWPQMTDDKRRLLGITVRSKHNTPAERPSMKPFLEVVNVDGNTATVRILQSKVERAKPKGVVGAILYSAVSPTPPTSESGWFSEGITTKSTNQVQFPDTVAPGSRVWFTAVWYNRKAETGPVANVVGTNLPGGAAFSKAA